MLAQLLGHRQAGHASEFREVELPDDLNFLKKPWLVPS